MLEFRSKFYKPLTAPREKLLNQNNTIIGLLLATAMLGVLFAATLNSAPVEQTRLAVADATKKSTTSSASTGGASASNPKKQDKSMPNSDIVNITMTTNHGDIKLELYADKAPLTVANFVAYADEGFYNDTIFHRVIDGFMIQGGGFTDDFKQKATNDHLQNEADNGLKNDTGTIAMARTPDPHSATAQFFINLSDNDFLNFRSADDNGYGYAVFGKVVDGMDVVNKIKSVATGAGGPMPTDVPQETVYIEAVTIGR